MIHPHVDSLFSAILTSICFFFRMRPKPVPSATKANDTHRNNNSASPIISQASPIIRGGKVPWSGIAAGTGSSYNQYNSNNNTMSFANAAASSISRSTNTGGRSTIGSSIGSPNLKRSQLFGSANSSKNSSFNTSSRWGDDTKELSSEQPETDSKEAEYALLENNGGRNYSVEEMLSIWEEMKRNNLIKPSIEQKNDLFHSILPNQPAVLDPTLQQSQESQNGDASASNESGKAGDNTHSNQSSISGNTTGNASVFADRLLSAKPSLSDIHKDNGFSQTKSISQSENITHSPSSSIVLPGVTTSSWSPFGNTATALASNSESVFKSNGILPKSDLFNSGIGFHAGTPPPPGISSPVPTLIGPDNINWIYKDPSGAEQGPFNGIRMQEWYASKWLQEFLLIRRVDESEFYTLKDFMTKVNNFFEPFLVPLPGSSRSGYFDDSQRLQEELLQRQRETMRRQQLQQYAAIQLQQQNSGWGSMSPITTPMSPMSHWAQPQPMSSLGQSPFEFGGPGGLSGGLSGSQISLNHLNNDVWQPRAPGSIPHTPKRVPSATELNFPQVENSAPKRSILSELEDSESSVPQSSKDLLVNDDELLVSEPSPVVSSAIQPPFKSPVNEVKPVKQPVESVAHPIVQNAESVVPEPFVAPEPAPTKKSKAKSSKKSASIPDQPTPVVAKAALVTKVEKSVEEVTLALDTVTVKDDPELAPVPSPKAITPVLAPWAKKEPVKSRAPSIKEIQEMEAAELKTRKAQQQQQQLAASIIQASRSSTPSNAPALPSGATWATVGVASAAPKKTLAQIQKEEEEAARKRGATAANTNGRKYADLAASGSSSFRVASSTPAVTSAASSTTTSGGAWTTVGPGGKKVGSGATSAPTAAAIISAAPVVKKVETPVRSVPVVNSKLSAASEDFLNWCKSSLQDLHSGVNQTELLSMLFSLPASSESKEIIAETIYSSSTTMDGRRFADEFIKRRKSADNEISSNTSWSDILQKAQTASKPVNDGWNVSFKVVGKKKGRKE
jgi:PERQ amino acid-rich with GYF domain-containing protein